MEADLASRPPGRRTFVIDPGFQLRYTALLAGLGAFVPALFGALMYIAHLEASRGLEAAFRGMGAAMPPELRGQLTEASTTLVWLISAAVVLMAVALALFGLLITHRVAGPVHVMGRSVAELAQGRFPRLRPLRQGDELQRFFQQLHEAIEVLRRRELSEAEALRQAVEQLTPLLGAAAGALDGLRALEAKKREAATC